MGQAWLSVSVLAEAVIMGIVMYDVFPSVLIWRRRTLASSPKTKTAIVAALLAMLVATSAAPQRRDTKPARGPRALAVVEFPEEGKPRLLPVAILIEGKYYDAEVYKATPAPMALEPGTVYEVGRSGESAGIFVVTRPVRVGNRWVAEGDWRPNRPPGFDSKPKQDTEAPKANVTGEDDGPPLLRRGSAQDKTNNDSSKPGPPSTTTGGDAPPVLRKPPADTTPNASKGESKAREEGKAPDQDQEDRDKGQPSSGEPSANASSAADESEDPSRPRLRRNVGLAPSQVDAMNDEPERETPRGNAGADTTAHAAAKDKAAPLAQVKEMLPAISDAKPDQPRDYRFDWRPEEWERLEKSATTLARSALQAYAGTHGRSGPGELQEVQVHIFNLDFSNTPYLVITARAEEKPAVAPSRKATARKVMGSKATGTEASGDKASPAGQSVGPPPPAQSGFSYYVTALAREGLNQEVRSVLVRVTDSSRINVVPRLELVDAIDADGDQRAELLFRESSEQGSEYKLYRIVGDRSTELFSSGPGGE